MGGEEKVRALVREVAPDLGGLALSAPVDGFDKTVWFLGDHHMVRVARHEVGRRRLRREHGVLGRLDGRVGPARVPQVVGVAADGGADVCRRVDGRALDWREWREVPLSVKAALAAPMGEAIAAFHDAVPIDSAADLQLPPPRVAGPGALDALAGRTGDPARERLRERVVARAASLPAVEPVVLHNDLGLHNVSLDPDTLAFRGIFDFGDVAQGDPHVDVRYDPVFEAGGPGMLGAYEAARGHALSPGRQALLHAMAALHNLLHSLDHEGPELRAVRNAWVDAVAAWDPARYDG